MARLHVKPPNLSDALAMNLPTPAAAAWDLNLGFNMQRQLQAEWCWSASAVSIAGFYDASCKWTQCSLACDQFGTRSCCMDGSSAVCDQPGFLDQALARTGNLAGDVVPPLTFDALKAELDAGHPVAARIGWQGGGGHFVIVSGYQASESRVLIDDPESDMADYDFANFANAYRGAGMWTHTYRTQAAVGSVQSSKCSCTLPVHATSAVRTGIARVERGALNHMSLTSTEQMLHQPLATQPVYFGALRAFANGLGLSEAFLVGYRTLLATESGPAACEISVNSSGIEMSPNVYRSPSVASSVEQLRELRQSTTASGLQVRYLRVPALFVRALWIKAPCDANDILIALRPTPKPLQAGKHYLRPDFESALRPLAVKRMAFPAPPLP